ncbi:MAG: hypothetical protein KAJ10_10685, partial [Thermodesulfovibrionia bacterium]|nr:hypothetical protein [Thermodesulfovibrionia bacterium]
MLKTIRNKFVVLFIFLVTVTIILIGIVSDYTIQRQITQSVAESFLDDLTDEISKIETFLSKVKADLNMFSGESLHNLITALDNGDKKNIARQRLHLENKFIKYMEVKRIYSQISYLNIRGKEILKAEFDGEKAFISREE